MAIVDSQALLFSKPVVTTNVGVFEITAHSSITGTYKYVLTLFDGAWSSHDELCNICAKATGAEAAIGDKCTSETSEDGTVIVLHIPEYALVTAVTTPRKLDS